MSTVSGELQASTLSISQVQILSDLTALPITTILGVSPQSDPLIQLIDPEAFCLSIRTMLKARDIQRAVFEEQVGWEVGGFIDEPHRLYDIVNWYCLMDLASSVGIDPIATLPPGNQLSE